MYWYVADLVLVLHSVLACHFSIHVLFSTNAILDWICQKGFLEGLHCTLIEKEAFYQHCTLFLISPRWGGPYNGRRNLSWAKKVRQSNFLRSFLCIFLGWVTHMSGETFLIYIIDKARQHFDPAHTPSLIASYNTLPFYPLTTIIPTDKKNDPVSWNHQISIPIRESDLTVFTIQGCVKLSQLQAFHNIFARVRWLTNVIYSSADLHWATVMVWSGIDRFIYRNWVWKFPC